MGWLLGLGVVLLGAWLCAGLVLIWIVAVASGRDRTDWTLFDVLLLLAVTPVSILFALADWFQGTRDGGE